MSDIEQGPVDFRRVDIPAFIKRLVRYYETQGNGDWRYAAEIIEQQNTEIERLRARVAELEAELAEAKSDLEWERNPGQNGF